MHLLLSVVCVHVVCADLVLIIVVFDDPVAPGRQETHCLCYVAKGVFVDYHSPLCYLLLALWFHRHWLLLFLYCCRRAFVPENVILLLVLGCLVAFLVVLVSHLEVLIFIKKTVVFHKLSLNFFFLKIFNFFHESHIDKSAYLSFLIFWPYKFGLFFAFWWHQLVFGCCFCFFRRTWLSFLRFLGSGRRHAILLLFHLLFFSPKLVF